MKPESRSSRAMWDYERSQFLVRHSTKETKHLFKRIGDPRRDLGLPWPRTRPIFVLSFRWGQGWKTDEADEDDDAYDQDLFIIYHLHTYYCSKCHFLEIDQHLSQSYTLQDVRGQIVSYRASGSSQWFEYQRLEYIQLPVLSGTDYPTRLKEMKVHWSSLCLDLCGESHIKQRGHQSWRMLSRDPGYSRLWM